MTSDKEIYCHFAFRHPKGLEYAIFAAVLYAEKAAKTLITAKTSAYIPWDKNQYVKALQAYEHALDCIWLWQSKLKKHKITQVYLVTSNKNLVKWLSDPKGYKKYNKWLEQIAKQYGLGGSKEITIPIGLCVLPEKAQKFCTQDKISNKIPKTDKKIDGYRLAIQSHKNIIDILKEEKPKGIDKIKTLE